MINRRAYFAAALSAALLAGAPGAWAKDAAPAAALTPATSPESVGFDSARLAKLYAQYRVLAAANRLIEALGVNMPAEAWSNERATYKVNVIPPEDMQESSLVQPVMGPPAPAAAPEPAVAPEPMPAGQ